MKPYYEHARITIYNCDCREILPTLKADVVITDPPYESLNVAVSTGVNTRLLKGPDQFSGKRLASLERGSWFPTLSSPEIVAILTLAVSRIAPSGAMYVFADVKSGLEIFPALVPRNVIVWDKTAIGMGYGWRRQHEWIAYCPNGRHVLRDKGAADIVRVPVDADKAHATQKPVNVIVPLVLNSSDPGQTILDPFMGSGTTLIAAKQLGRKAIGVEIEERYCEIAARRLAQEVLPLEAPAPEPTQESFL